MIITCPNNPNHSRFKIDYLVSEEWIIADNGDCLDSLTVARSPGR